MSNNAYGKFNTTSTPQTEPIPGRTDQVKNNAGGYVFTVDPWAQFMRFLILGTEGGTYYVDERKLTKDNAVHVMKMIEADGLKAVKLMADVSDQGRAVKNDPAIFALALASVAKDEATRKAAYANLDKVCRIPTHLFHFLTYRKNVGGGWGMGLRKAINAWLNRWTPSQLAFEFAKYQSRDGWSNADVLRKVHPDPTNVTQDLIFKWAVDGFDEMDKKFRESPLNTEGIEKIRADLDILYAMQTAHTVDNKNDLVRLIEQKGLSREMIPTQYLSDPDVWDALLQKMPPTALLRNLGNMAKVGLLKPLSIAEGQVVSKLSNVESLKKGRIHPLSVLTALKVYGQGHGVRGDGSWTPTPKVKDALDSAFYTCFQNIVPTNKRHLIGVDMSGSMTMGVGNLPLTAAECAMALALCVAKVEPQYYIHGFYTQFRDLGITAKSTLSQVFDRAMFSTGGGTDCALPMMWAESQKIDVDVFIVITDNETWAGRMQPTQALASYRRARGINAKQVVCATAATPFTIADPNDPFALDIVGFDTQTPQAISEFVRL